MNNPKAFQDSPAGRVLPIARGDFWAYVPNPLPPKLEWTPELMADLLKA